MNTKNQKISGKKDSNWLYPFVSAMPPFIFMFYLYGRNSAYINYWHVLLVTLVFALGGLVLYWIVARMGKSPQAAALVSVVLWILFFTVRQATNALNIIFVPINRFFRYSIVVVPVAVCLFIVFYFGRRLRKYAPFQILAVFETVIFLLNFVPATLSLATEKPSGLSDSGYTNNFTVDANSPSPNIYWLFMDGMLGFKAMEDIFDDPQIEFESLLTERGFLVNREAQFEVSHSTERAIPALMSPHYYDEVMTPILASINLNDNDAIMNSIGKLDTTEGKINNEFVFAFNAKGYQTNTLAISYALYFYPTTTHFYAGGYELRRKDFSVLESGQVLMQLQDLSGLMRNTAIPGILLFKWIDPLLVKLAGRQLELVNIPPSGIDKQPIYGNSYHGYDAWYIDALAEIFKEPEPRMTIIHDIKAHGPFILNEDGSLVGRTKGEGLNPYNYPPQHRFTRDVLVRMIDLIIAHDPDAVIVVEADHGLHMVPVDKILAMPGGNADTVRLMYNQTMSAVRIPEKWGGLDAPLDPLNITRVLVNRYVGENYTLLETHP